MNKLFSAEPLWQKGGLVLLRIVTGLLMAYHGLEIFNPAQMQDYSKWDVIQTLPAPLLMVYIGKGLELITGIFLAIGLFTRLSAIFLSINMLFICFKIGHGKFYYDDQHPFLFALLGLVFVFTGPVAMSLDQRLFNKK